MTDQHPNPSAATISSPGAGEPIEIVDGHVHFWDTTRLTYDWLAECGDLNAPMLPERLRTEIETTETSVPFRIKGFVQVQADADPAENFDEIEWIKGFRGEYPFLGMVAYAALEDGEAVEETLARLEVDPFVKGVRRSTQNEPEDYVLQPGYLTGLELLGRHGLTADICGRGFQLPNVIKALHELRDRGADTTIVIDHAGKPRIPDYPFEDWAASMKQLAAIPGVHCKLSGLLAEVADGKWSEERIRPYLETAIETFGEDRVLFSGDWPIVKFVDAEYRDWVQVVYATVGQLGPDAVRKIFADNAVRIYGL